MTPRHTHAVARGLELLQALGLPEEPADFGAAKLLHENPDTTQRWLKRHPEPFALVHPGAGWGNKRYPAARWGEVAIRLRAEASLRVWVAAGPGEEALAEEVATASQGAAQVVPAPTLPELGALLRQASLVLGGDTGPLHLAHALATPALFVMGPTDPERHGPYGFPERALARRLPCSYCYQRLATTKACLLDIRPDEIVRASMALLSELPVLGSGALATAPNLKLTPLSNDL